MNETPNPNTAPAEVWPTKGRLRAALIDNDNVLRDILMRVKQGPESVLRYLDYIQSQLERVGPRNHDLLCECGVSKVIQQTPAEITPLPPHYSAPFIKVSPPHPDTARGFSINSPVLVAGPPIEIESTGYRDGDGNLWVDEFARWTEPEPAKDLPVTLRLSVEGAKMLRKAVCAYPVSYEPGELDLLNTLRKLLPESVSHKKEGV